MSNADFPFTPVEAPLKVVQGDDFRKSYQFKLDGLPFPLVGFSAEAHFRTQVSNDVAVLELNSAPGGGIEIDELNGLYSIVITNVQTSELVSGGFYDVEWTSPGGLKGKSQRGPFFVVPEVTRLPLPGSESDLLYTNKVSFASAPSDTNYDHLLVPESYRLKQVFILHDDPADPDPAAIPTAGTLILERREVGGTLHTQLDAGGPIELDKLDDFNSVLLLSITAGVDSDGGNTAAKLITLASARVYAVGQVCKVTVTNLACADNAELHIWALCERS